MTAADAGVRASAAQEQPADAWADHLDALEEWLRRAEVAVRGGEQPLLPLHGEPATPLLPAHGLRARVVLARMQQLAEVGARRRADLERAAAYVRP